MFLLARALAAACLALLPAPALPGAWPREPGKIFLSIRSDYEAGSGDVRTAVYGEYGFSRRITFGFTASDGPPDYAKENEDEWRLEQAATALVSPPSRRRVGSFVKLAVGPLEATNRFALSLGASAPPDQYGLMTEYQIEAAVHWGRGLTTRWGDGWATATAKVILARDEDRPITDFYGLVGLKPADDWMTMLSLNRYADTGGTTWKTTTSAGYRATEKVWIVPSLSYGFGNGNSQTSVGLALWLNF